MAMLADTDWGEYGVFPAKYETLMCSDTTGPGKRGHIVADTLLPTQMFPRLPARATLLRCVRETKKCF